MGMSENDFLKAAKRMKVQLITWRRFLHENAEVGFDTKRTADYIQDELNKMGYTAVKRGKFGVLASVGEGARCFLLRADMDALPIKERAREPFACKKGNMHACGHDLHTAMLLGAARLLKAGEKELKGRVKLLFQAAEESLEGAKNAVQNGVLESPRVDAAMMIHVLTGVELPVGTAIVSSAGISAPAADYFTVELLGKGCHGSAPWKGVDATLVAAYLTVALQELPAREIPIGDPAVLTVGSLHAGETGNVIADRATLKGTLRAFDETRREEIKKRLREIATATAKTFRARASVHFDSGCPTLVNDGGVSAFIEGAAKKILKKNAVYTSAELSGGVKKESGGSEDFAYIAQEVPSVMVAVAAGEKGKGYDYPLHHPKVRFDENALPIGAALYAGGATAYLEERGGKE